MRTLRFLGMTLLMVIPKNLNVLIVAKLVIIYVYKLLYHYVVVRV